MASLRFSTYTVMSSINNEFYFLSSIWNSFYFCYLTVVARTSDTVLNKKWGEWVSCFVPYRLSKSCVYEGLFSIITKHLLFKDDSKRRMQNKHRLFWGSVSCLPQKYSSALLSISLNKRLRVPSWAVYYENLQPIWNQKYWFINRSNELTSKTWKDIFECQS